MSIPIKTSAQIEAMREGGKILRQIHMEIGKMIKPGISTMSLEKKAEELFVQYGVVPSFKGYKGYPFILCTSPNEVVVHGMPSEDVILKDGDIISVDCGVFYKGLHTDSCWTYLVGNVDYKFSNLSDTVKKALDKGIKQVRPGAKIGDIESTVERVIKQGGYCPIWDCTGHGVGVKLHEPPEILNYGKEGKGPELKAGMVLAIEPSATLGNSQYTYNKNKDKWTLIAKDHAICAQWEHTVLVTETGYEILT